MGKNTRLQEIIVDHLSKGVGEGDVDGAIEPQEIVGPADGGLRLGLRLAA